MKLFKKSDKILKISKLNHISCIIYLIAFFFSVNACTPYDPYAPIPSQGQICVTIKHHANIVPNSRVFLKYDSDVFLGFDSTKYQKHYQTDSLAKTCINELPTGTHCLMILGYDHIFGAKIYGYKVFTIKKVDEKITTDIFVSE